MVEVDVAASPSFVAADFVFGEAIEFTYFLIFLISFGASNNHVTPSLFSIARALGPQSRLDFHLLASHYRYRVKEVEAVRRVNEYHRK